MMGDYLEKNIHAFTEMQNAFQEQSKKLVEGKASFPTADAWTQMIQGQNPMMQNLMGGYLEQSKTMMMQMQEQMQKNAQSMFQGFQFPPAGSGDAAKKDSE
jgi:polyhydroxyalkanoate synthesis regulator protein